MGLTIFWVRTLEIKLSKMIFEWQDFGYKIRNVLHRVENAMIEHKPTK